MKLTLQALLILVFAIACSRDPLKVTPDSALTLGSESNIADLGLYSCNIPYSIDITAAPSSLPYKTWVASVINDFNNKDTYLKFAENNNQYVYGKIYVRFQAKENFQNTLSKGVFSFSNYAISRIDSSNISLNSDFDWTETLVKKAIAYHIGQMLKLPYNGNDKESIMNPDVAQTYKGLSSGDIQNFQSAFNSASLSGSITKGSVSARSISLSWNISNPQGRYIKGSGLCWSSINSSPTINDEKNFFTGSNSGSWATGWNKPGAAVYFRSYFITECETIYSPVLKLNVPQNNTWEAGAVAPFLGRTGTAVVATDGIFGKAFIIGGKLTSSNELTNEVWMHQPGLNLWKQVKSFPGTKRENATTFFYQDKIYYGLGSISNNSNNLIDWWEYNITNDTWTQKGNAFTTGRPGTIGFSTSTGGIFTLGLSTSTGAITTSTRLYNSTNDTWSTLPSFPFSSGTKGYCTNNDTPYVLLPTNRLIGFNKGGNYWFETSSFPYDNPTSNTISNQQNTMVSCQSKVYYGSKNLFDWYQFNSSTNNWAKKANSPAYFISSSIMYSIGDKVYVVDGSSGKVWEYNVD